MTRPFTPREENNDTPAEQQPRSNREMDAKGARRDATTTDDDDDDDHVVPDDVVPPAATTTTTASVRAVPPWSRNAAGRGGRFTAEETAVVRRAVEEYCAARGGEVDAARLCSERRVSRGSTRGAWAEIAAALPHRTVQSVYRHGTRLLHPFKRGPWTEAERETLASLIDGDPDDPTAPPPLGRRWSLAQTRLHRSADACRDKYREMNRDYKKGRWEDDETKRLVEAVREEIRAPPATTDVDADDAATNLDRWCRERSVAVPWSAVSRRMKTRSRLSCSKKWRKMIAGGAKEKNEGARSPPPPPQKRVGAEEGHKRTTQDIEKEKEDDDPKCKRRRTDDGQGEAKAKSETTTTTKTTTPRTTIVARKTTTTAANVSEETTNADPTVVADAVSGSTTEDGRVDVDVAA